MASQETKLQNTNGNNNIIKTSGAKLFSSHSASPTDRPLPDTDPDLYRIQKSQIQHAPFGIFKEVGQSLP